MLDVPQIVQKLNDVGVFPLLLSLTCSTQSTDKCFAVPFKEMTWKLDDIINSLVQNIEVWKFFSSPLFFSLPFFLNTLWAASFKKDKACNFIKKETLVFSCEFRQISKKNFFYRTPLIIASGKKYFFLKWWKLFSKNRANNWYSTINEQVVWD